MHRNAHGSPLTTVTLQPHQYHKNVRENHAGFYMDLIREKPLKSFHIHHVTVFSVRVVLLQNSRSEQWVIKRARHSGLVLYLSTEVPTKTAALRGRVFSSSLLFRRCLTLADTYCFCCCTTNKSTAGVLLLPSLDCGIF